MIQHHPAHHRVNLGTFDSCAAQFLILVNAVNLDGVLPLFYSHVAHQLHNYKNDSVCSIKVKKRRKRIKGWLCCYGICFITSNDWINKSST